VRSLTIFANISSVIVMSEHEPTRKRKLNTRLLSARYGVSTRTVDRWVAAGILPEPMRINRLKYWDEDEVEQRDRERTQ